MGSAGNRQARKTAAPATVLLATFMGIALGLLAGMATMRSRSQLTAVLRQQLATLQQESKDRIQSLTVENARLGSDKSYVQEQLQTAKAALMASDGAGLQQWGPSPERDAQNPKLAAVLRKIAVGNEVMVAISNRNYGSPGGMLQTWVEAAQRCNVSNAMVVALDDDTMRNVQAWGFTAFRMDAVIPKSQEGVGMNHAVSGLKFKILAEFLKLGYAVLLSDVDIVTLQNPFNHLVRDCDVEGMSDGFDNGTAYGWDDVYDDPTMGWSRWAHSIRVFVINSGLFYMKPTKASMAVLDRVADRLEKENGWDQAIFNEVLFFPSRPGYNAPFATRRIMDMFLFMNSKVLFRTVRVDPRFADLQPVMVHVNYHPDKHPRMLAIVRRYVHGDKQALASFSLGS